MTKKQARDLDLFNRMITNLLKLFPHLSVSQAVKLIAQFVDVSDSIK